MGRCFLTSLAIICFLHLSDIGFAKNVVVEFTAGTNSTLKGVYVQKDFWFELSEDWDLKDPCKLKLTFSHSPVVVAPVSTLTIALNQSPVQSIHLTPANVDSTLLEVTIPSKYLRGGMNVLSIIVKMRSDNKDLCEDVHNPALWTLIDSSSYLEISYEEKIVEPNLSRFPSSYENPDLLYSKSKDRVHAIILMPQEPDSAELNALGGLAIALGIGVGLGKGEFKVIQNIRGDISEIKNKHIIVVGKQEHLGGIMSPPWNIPLDLNQIRSEPGGRLMEFGSPLNPTRRLLVVTGRDDEALSLVTAHLKSPPSFLNLKGSEMVFYKPPIIETGSSEGGGPAFVVRLQDLKMSDIITRGKFYHSLTFTCPNPYVGKIKDGAFIRLSMSHSELLLPQSSSLLIKMNGEPIKSIRLTRETASRNTWDVKIPVVYLGSRFLTVELEIFMDIGDPDCYYNHPEMAWFALHNDTFIYLPVDTNQGETLANYPYMFLSWNQFNNLSALLVNPITDGILSVFVNIIAYLSQSLRSPSFVELTVASSSYIKETLLLSNLLIIGSIGSIISDTTLHKVIPNELSVRLPDKDPSDLLNSAGFISLMKSPFTDNRHVLTVLGRSDQEIWLSAPYLYASGKVEWVRGTLVAVLEDKELRVLLPPTDDTMVSRFDPTKVRFEEKEGKLIPILETPKPLPPPSRHNVAYLIFFIVTPILVILAILRFRAIGKKEDKER